MALTGDRSFRDEVVRLTSLTVTSNVLDGYTFSNCQIIGPAVLAILDNNEIAHCSFSGSIDAIMWVVDPVERPMVVGAVGVANCTFSGCDFREVGFAGPLELKQAFEGGTNP